MTIRDALFVALILGGSGVLVTTLAPGRAASLVGWTTERPRLELPSIIALIDRTLRDEWQSQSLKPSVAADDLMFLRRLAFGLTGSAPSLEMIRRFEVLPAATRRASWLDELLTDRRTSDYLAERLARGFVGTEGGPFLVYRRRRLIAWLSDGLDQNRPYDAIVRDLIADRGLWTDHPATNFITVTFDPEKKAYDPERLGARVARAFLGVRLDCAQCHDHPFEPWKQADFQGLAAFFGQVAPSISGITDGSGEFRPSMGMASGRGDKVPAVEPRVPFHPELVGLAGSRRERLAQWVTHPSNDFFARVTVNRAWALLFGRPLVTPIDDLSSGGEPPAVLGLLADDFARNGYDWRRLLRVIASTEAFGLESAVGVETGSPLVLEAAWAAFPVTRLRPEQIANAITQSTATETIDADAPLLLRLIRSGEVDNFVTRHGDLGENEFEADPASTIPQRLLVMNGKLVQENFREGMLAIAGRVATLAHDDRQAIEAAYLIALTRRPTEPEARHFAARLAVTAGDDRQKQVADLFWVLLNSTELACNH